ncbi:hypothetical protein GWK47_017127 [Chionoecetes opilio]|uniref:Uncharacterized protein n=1 Tax=Chionoecetes opilio TaxID=41210 RepID=A0A8J4XRK9_CHIOP|nr:hypothetical protein GWK47_017127 [Chionoecetes opilio]
MLQTSTFFLYLPQIILMNRLRSCVLFINTFKDGTFSGDGDEDGRGSAGRGLGCEVVLGLVQSCMACEVLEVHATAGGCVDTCRTEERRLTAAGDDRRRALITIVSAYNDCKGKTEIVDRDSCGQSGQAVISPTVKGGGGVLVWASGGFIKPTDAALAVAYTLRNDIPCTCAHSLESHNFLPSGFDFNVTLIKFICAVYCSPYSTDYVQFFDYLTSKVEHISSHFSLAEISILRDFNVHHQHFTDQPVEFAYRCSILQDLEQLVQHPTLLEENTALVDMCADVRRLPILEALYIKEINPKLNVQANDLQALPSMKRTRANNSLLTEKQSEDQTTNKRLPLTETRSRSYLPISAANRLRGRQTSSINRASPRI